MARRATSFEKGGKCRVSTSTTAGQSARADIEAIVGHPVSDDEWHRQSNRLEEYVRILSRWDAEQRDAGRCAKIDSKERVA